MKINLSQAGKRFNREWIFRNATLEFQPNFSYAITGPNGSGKSTLLQCIAGMMQLSQGTVQYTINGRRLPNEQLYKHVSFCAPYLELIEEMTLIEFLHFHFCYSINRRMWKTSTSNCRRSAKRITLMNFLHR